MYSRTNNSMVRIQTAFKRNLADLVGVASDTAVPAVALGRRS